MDRRVLQHVAGQHGAHAEVRGADANGQGAGGGLGGAEGVKSGVAIRPLPTNFRFNNI